MSWFEKLKKSRSAKVKIGLYSASDILHELMYRRTIRNTYFPNALLDPLELRRIVSKMGELSIKELETLTEDNLEDFTERLKDQDARDWQNPYLIVQANGISVRPITISTPTMSALEVITYLEKLPSTAWPYGLVVAVSENSLRSGADDDARIKKNREELVRLLEKAGIKVDFWGLSVKSNRDSKVLVCVG